MPLAFDFFNSVGDDLGHAPRWGRTGLLPEAEHTLRMSVTRESRQRSRRTIVNPLSRQATYSDAISWVSFILLAVGGSRMR